jgi:uncharacterized membrane protein YfbV (UPF0208 family)
MKRIISITAFATVFIPFASLLSFIGYQSFEELLAPPNATAFIVSCILLPSIILLMWSLTVVSRLIATIASIAYDDLCALKSDNT